MSVRLTLLTALRVLRQIANDRRTVALLLLVPTLLLALLRYVMNDAPQVFNAVGLSMLGVFPFVTMFLVTSVAMLRERTSGTLERILTTPIHKFDLIGGYALAFAVAAVLQSVIATGTAYWLLDLETQGSTGLVVLIAAANALLGVAIGLLVSAFANSEFQAVQFMPAVVLPQFLLCGLIWPRGEMIGWLQGVSDFMPLTYAVDGLAEVGANADPTEAMWQDLSIVLAVAVAALVVGSATLRRRTG
ncbi:MAG: ABC transporter permease [Stackebrandtia sp.]